MIYYALQRYEKNATQTTNPYSSICGSTIIELGPPRRVTLVKMIALRHHFLLFSLVQFVMILSNHDRSFFLFGNAIRRIQGFILSLESFSIEL